MINKLSTPSVKTRIDRLRHKFLSITQAGQQLQAIARKIIKEQRRALIHVDGQKAAVLIPYAEYQQLEKLRTQQMKTDVLQQLESLVARRTGHVA